MQRHISTSSRTSLLAAAALVLAGCPASSPLRQADHEADHAGARVSPSGPDQTGKTAASAEPKAGATEPDEGPVRFRLDDDAIFSPAPPEGVVGIAVPTAVAQPTARYSPGPASRLAESLTLTEIPEPKRRGAPRMARVENGSQATWLEPTSTGVTVEDPRPLAPALSSDFDSTDFNTNSVNTGGFLFIPPDPIAAAGPGHVVNVTNVTIRFHQKNGTLDADNSLASFFSALSPVNELFDPKVLYDQHAGRFLVVALERQDVLAGDPVDDSRILVAVSDDSDPNGMWYQAAIPSKLAFPDPFLGGSVDHWADYPGFAVDEEAVYITANMFQFFSTGAFFDGTRIWMIDKIGGSGGGFYGGGTATVNGPLDPYASASPDCLSTILGPFCGTTQPAHIYGTAPAGSVGTWLTLYQGLTQGGNEFLQVMRVDDPLGAPTFVGPTLVPLGNVDNTALSMPDAPQLGSGEEIETNDRRTLDSVWRNDSLYVTTTLVPNTGPDFNQATAHWIQVDTSVLGSPTLEDQGNLGGEDIADEPGQDPAGKFTFFPSVAVNGSGIAAYGFSASGASIYAGSYYTTVPPGAPPKSDTGTGTLRVGTDFYVRTFDSPPCQSPAARNRWGDYSGMALDPADQCFWVYNQHAIARGTNTAGGCNGRPDPEDGRWGTAYGKFCPSNNPPVANDDTYFAVQNTLLTIAAPGVLGNDTDAEGDILSAILVSDVTDGTLSLAGDGSFTYTSDPLFVGDDTFTYKANDTKDDSNVATVTITVQSTACPTTLRLEGLNVTGILSLEASTQITASTVTIQSGGNLKLTAPLVAVDDGFAAESTAQVEIENDTCP